MRIIPKSSPRNERKALAAQPQEKAPKETPAEADNDSSATLQAETKAELKQALKAAGEATNLRDKAATDMFQLYANLLSVDARYAWNKIVQEQTEANPYQDLQGLTRKGPRGMSRQSFEDCVMFHLLTVFPNNVAEQERYYIMNVLKKPQCVSIHQFVQHVEQLNSYISQLPCWYYSPNVKIMTFPMNVSFAKADLASHVLQMCPYTWQDQYKERWCAYRPAFSPSVSRGYRARMWAGRIQQVQPFLRRESFAQREEGYEATWY